jgi:6-phosphogluconate dehydrogenase
MTTTADIGFVGLGVMGQNLVMNLDDHGFAVAVYNRTTATTEAFLAGPASGTMVTGTSTLAELVGMLARPRKIMLMVKAGPPVFSLVTQLVPLLEPGDIIIDGGNADYQDSTRLAKDLEAQGLLYVGCGVSGGEEGARHGPALMPGGSPAAWPHVRGMFTAIAAKLADGTPCCDWVGVGGAGHFVKMVHNGIEYGDMQLIGEAYDLMGSLLGLTPDEMSQVFADWNTGPLSSYLVEITSAILAFKDVDGTPLVDNILDTAGQKGTGRLAVSTAMEAGMPLTLIGEAVFARVLSALKDERLAATAVLAGPLPAFTGDREALVRDLGTALYAAKIVSYAQGYMLMRAMSAIHGWHLNFGGIASIWRGGCIIRAALLDYIEAAFSANPDLANLLLDPYFQAQVGAAQSAWRRMVVQGVEGGVPLPAFASGLIFYDGYRRSRLPANLLQAQRDYFGAHTYERVDRPRGAFFHTDWSGKTGSTAA